MGTDWSDRYLSAARGIVLDGSRACGKPLSERLEFRLSVAVSRHISEPLDCDLLSTRIAEAGQEGGPPETACRIGDACLITCVVFPDRLRRIGGSIWYYSGVGRTAYDMASMPEESLGFSHMMTVLAAAIRRPDDDLEALLDRAAAGDRTASDALGNVTPFRRA